MRGRVDPNRARRYIDRTDQAATAWADARAAVRGAHCAACEGDERLRQVHLSSAQFSSAMRQVVDEMLARARFVGGPR